MKILDPKNAGARLKAFLIWGTLLFIVQLIPVLLLSSIPDIVVVIYLLASVFAGYMTARALKNKTGDNRSSAIYGAVVPVYAAILSWIIFPLIGISIPISLPLFTYVSRTFGWIPLSKEILR